jgi:hypothetical protein
MNKSSLKLNKILEIIDDDIETNLIKIEATNSNDEQFLITLHGFSLESIDDKPALEIKCDTDIELSPEDNQEMERQVKNLILHIITEDNNENT